MSRAIHYSGGLDSPYRLRGWPACCSGERAERIAAQGRQTADRFQVTCSRCVRLIWPERVRRRTVWTLQ